METLAGTLLALLLLALLIHYLRAGGTGVSAYLKYVFAGIKPGAAAAGGMTYSVPGGGVTSTQPAKPTRPTMPKPNGGNGGGAW